MTDPTEQQIEAAAFPDEDQAIRIVDMGLDVARVERQRLRADVAESEIARMQVVISDLTNEIADLHDEEIRLAVERDDARAEWHRHNARADEWRGRASRAEAALSAATVSENAEITRLRAEVDRLYLAHPTSVGRLAYEAQVNYAHAEALRELAATVTVTARPDHNPYHPLGGPEWCCNTHAKDTRELAATVTVTTAEDQWYESLVQASCKVGHVVFIDDGDGGVYRCPLCALAHLGSELWTEVSS